MVISSSGSRSPRLPRPPSARSHPRLGPLWRDRGGRPILVAVLQELCPHCGNEWIDDTRPCPACGYDSVDTRGPSSAHATSTPLAPPILIGLSAAAVAAVVIVSGLASRAQSPSPSPGQTSSPTFAERADLPTPPRLGRVVFAEGIGAANELESRRSQFAPGDTIAWRAEFVDAPRAAELTVVIAWQSIRERMELSRDTVALAGAGVMSVVRDEVAIDELVPTAGLYSVSYFSGEAKLAEGVFELLPPDR